MPTPRPIALLATLTLAASTALVALTGPGVSADAATQPVQIRRVFYDSPGKDTRSAISLNAEYVLIANVSKSSRSLKGYTLRDAQHHVYRFAAFTLKAGKSVKVHTGKGVNRPANLYWGQSNYVWNNTGDRAVLRNAAGRTVDTCAYKGSGGVTAAGHYHNC